MTSNQLYEDAGRIHKLNCMKMQVDNCDSEYKILDQQDEYLALIGILER
jgi:hypothetical protein